MRMKRVFARSMGAMLTLSLCLIWLPSANAADAAMRVAGGDISVTVDGAGWKATQGGTVQSGGMSDTLSITGAGLPTEHTVTISGGSTATPLSLVLDNVSIATDGSALRLTNGANVALTLIGDNQLSTTGATAATVRVPADAVLAIAGGGTLLARNLAAPAIGDGDASGTVRIADGTRVVTESTGTQTGTITPAASGSTLPIAIQPRAAFPMGQCGGDYEVTIGAGIPSTDLGAANLGNLKITNANWNVTVLAEGTDFSVRDGSIIITLYARYLNSLPAGRYTLTATIVGGLYDGETPSIGILVVNPGADAGVVGESVPRTGDDAPVALLGLVALLSGAAFVLRRRTRRGKGHA